MAPERAIDPQQINLYAYVRNNPLRFNDTTGEIINEPTSFESDRDRKRYEDWKTKFLSTEAGRNTWQKYADDKNFTLDIVVTDRGSDDKNKSAQVENFKFDAKGNFIGATMTLGNNLGGTGTINSSNYPVTSTLVSADAHTLAAAKIGHEFGHLEDFRSMGSTFYEQQTIIDAYNTRYKALEGVVPYQQIPQDATIQRLDQQFTKQYGLTILQDNTARENRADRNAIPVIRQLFNGKPPEATRRAIKEVEGKPK
jgi:hypothetical protein